MEIKKSTTSSMIRKLMIFSIILTNINLTNAQIPQNIPITERMNAAIQFAMTDVCRIDRDSRQCELIQILYGKQNSRKTGESAEFAPLEVINNLLEVSSHRKNLLDKMEIDKKIKLSRTYKQLDTAKDRICSIDKTGEPCASILSYFIFQTDIEIGKELNPAPTVSIDTKNQVRKYIRKEHPNLTESSEILAEALMMWNLHNLSDNSTEKSGDKKSDPCSNQYSLLYDSKKCKNGAH